MGVRNVKTIEIICSANHDRSPVGELFVKQHIELRGIQGYRVLSSGTFLHDFRTGNVPIKSAIFYMRLASDLGLLSAKERKDVEALDEASESDLVKRAYLIANDKLLSLARYQKAIAMQELGFHPGGLKPQSDQTQLQENVAAIWCMTNKHVRAVQELYGQGAPPIMLLDERADIQDPYCLGVQVYKEVIGQIWSAVQNR